MPSIYKKHMFHDADGAEAECAGPAPNAERPVRRSTRRVELLRVDGVVRAIEVSCACGESTLIEIEYPQPSPAP